jgi:hypothetical protein
MITSETNGVIGCFFRGSIFIFFFLRVSHLFWASKRLFMGLEKKLVIRHNFLLVGRIN